MSDLLQGSQFFRERAYRAKEYEKEHSNGEAADDDDDGQVREIAAHKHVFHRP